MTYPVVDRRARRRGLVYGGGFLPGHLFRNGEQGVWYDPSDLTTLFQDSAGTTPVTADGDPVGLMLDKSGNGNHATQTVSSARPTYHTDGTLHWLSFDGVDDYLVTGNIDFTGTDKMSVFAGVRKLVGAANGTIVESSIQADTNNGAFFLRQSAGGLDNYQSLLRGTLNSATTPTLIPSPDTSVIGLIYDISAPTHDFRRNGVIAATNVDSVGGGSFGNYPLYIGRRGGTSIPFSGNIYGLLVRGASSSVADIGRAESYLAKKSGVVL